MLYNKNIYYIIIKQFVGALISAGRELMKKAYIAVINILVMLALIAYVTFFAFNLKERSLQTEKDAFVSTMEVLEHVSYNYLFSCQVTCDNWSAFVNSGSYTMQEAMDNLKRMNTDKNVSIQLIRSEDMSGISSVAKNRSSDDYSVVYTQTYNTLRDEFNFFAADNDKTKKIHITRNFNNPVNGNFVVAFCSNVTLRDQAGAAYKALLLYVNPLDQIRKRWVFPVGYSSAQMAMMNQDGEYIIRADAMKNENFYEFIRSYNKLTYPQSYGLRDRINAGRKGGFEYLNATGSKTYYAYTHLDESSWTIVGEIPLSDLYAGKMQWPLIAVLTLAFLILFIINAVYFISLNKKLESSLKVAEKASRAKTDFLSSMSHDIRTPMNAITGLTAIAERSIDEPEQVRDCLKKIGFASDHLLTLINDVLDISKVESGKLSLNPTDFSVVEAMHSLINISYPQITKKHLDFEVYTEKIVHERIFADELRISQIWINILSNAVKYTMEGGKITVRLREEETADKQPLLVFIVADTGIGMSEEFVKIIFDDFTREKDSRIDEIQGSGLGMAITKHMTDLMKGTIDVKSEIGKGSVFTVRLPVSAADGDNEIKTFVGKEALVADADGEIAQNAAETLKAMGLSAEYAQGVDEAAAKINAKRKAGQAYDIIFVGAETDNGKNLRCLREAAGEKTKLVLASYDYAGMSKQEIEAGADAHIMKPYFRSVLSEKLDDVFNHKAVADEESAKTDFSGINVLVAEDNDINWEIIDKLLSFYSINAVRAENGKECVDIIEKSPKDKFLLIFMDIQMPVMDGYEATKAIRALADPDKAKAPVIAMTADAFAEDIEECRKAGMNGHIAKPLSVDKIIAEIEKYRGTEG